MASLDAGPATVRYLTQRYGLPYGDGTLTPVARGAMGRIWRLSFPERDYAVKEAFWGSDESTVVREVELTRAAATAGVKCPFNFQTDEGTYTCDLPAELGGATVRTFSWVDGHLASYDAQGIAPWVGQTLGMLHALRLSEMCDGVAPDPWYDQVPDEEHWNDLVARAETAAQAGDAVVRWAPLMAPAIPKLRSLSTHVVPLDATNLLYCHLDLQPQNVMVDPSGDYVLLDWEDAGPAMPDQVLAGVLCCWCIQDGVVDSRRVREVLTAYRRAGGHAALTGMESFSASVAGHLNYLAAQASVSLDATLSPDMRAHAADELTRALAGPPRLDLFAEILRVAQTHGEGGLSRNVLV